MSGDHNAHQNDFKPDWDTVKAYDEKFAEMLRALELYEAFLLSAGLASTELYSEVCTAIGKVIENKK
jgi:hypothetical protein